MAAEFKTYFRSEIGLIEIVSDDEAIKALYFIDDEAQIKPINQSNKPNILNECLTQLQDYFEGRRTEFSLKLDPDGTSFQKAVWQQLLNIPYGQTASYLDIARMVGNTKAVRAIGAANGQNRISIIIPCHRVIQQSGALGGYRWGPARKQVIQTWERLRQSSDDR